MAIATRSLLDPSPENLIKWGGDWGPRTLNGQWWRLFTSMFVHIGVIHLLFNMYVLANIGFFMEAVLGTSPYLILYLVSGLGSGAASLWSHPNTVSAGASGAIFGLYGGLLAFLLLNRNFISPQALGSLAKGAVVFIGYNVFFSLTQPEVDLAAHLGGLVAGFLAGLVLVVPVDQIAIAERGRRITLATALGVGIVVVTMVALPKSGDLLGAVKRMATVEEATMAKYRAAVDKFKAGNLSSQQFEEVLQKEILPPWRSEREAMSKLNGLPKQQSAIASSLTRYMQVREDSWILLGEGIHNQNLQKIQQANQKAKEAEQMAKQLMADAKP
jgi:rhomboid protease GluP